MGKISKGILFILSILFFATAKPQSGNKDYTFCYGSVAVTLYAGGDASQVRYGSNGTLIKTESGEWTAYGSPNDMPGQTIKVNYEGGTQEYSYVLIRDGFGVPAWLIDGQGRKYNMCKSKAGSEIQSKVPIEDKEYIEKTKTNAFNYWDHKYDKNNSLAAYLKNKSRAIQLPVNQCHIYYYNGRQGQFYYKEKYFQGYVFNSRLYDNDSILIGELTENKDFYFLEYKEEGILKKIYGRKVDKYNIGIHIRGYDVGFYDIINERPSKFPSGEFTVESDDLPGCMISSFGQLFDESGGYTKIQKEAKMEKEKAEKLITKEETNKIENGMTSDVVKIDSSLNKEEIDINVPKNGLVGWWPFNGNANDESGNDNNGTLSGPTLTTDRFGNMNSAFNFDGNNQWINMPSGSGTSINIVGDLTLTFWFKTNQNRITGLIGFGDNVNGAGGLLVAIGNGVPLSGAKHMTVCSNNIWREGNVSLTDDIWHFACITISGRILKIIIDNKVDAKFTDVKPPLSYNGLRAIAARNDGQGGFFNGVIDDIGLWNRNLTEGEVNALYIYKEPMKN